MHSPQIKKRRSTQASFVAILSGAFAQILGLLPTLRDLCQLEAQSIAGNVVVTHAVHLAGIGRLDGCAMQMSIHHVVHMELRHQVGYACAHTALAKGGEVGERDHQAVRAALARAL